MAENEDLDGFRASKAKIKHMTDKKALIEELNTIRGEAYNLAKNAYSWSPGSPGYEACITLAQRRALLGAYAVKRMVELGYSPNIQAAAKNGYAESLSKHPEYDKAIFDDVQGAILVACDLPEKGSSKNSSSNSGGSSSESTSYSSPKATPTYSTPTPTPQPASGGSSAKGCLIFFLVVIVIALIGYGYQYVKKTYFTTYHAEDILTIAGGEQEVKGLESKTTEQIGTVDLDGGEFAMIYSITGKESGGKEKTVYIAEITKEKEDGSLEKPSRYVVAEEDYLQIYALRITGENQSKTVFLVVNERCARISENTEDGFTATVESRPSIVECPKLLEKDDYTCYSKHDHVIK